MCTLTADHCGVGEGILGVLGAGTVVLGQEGKGGSVKGDGGGGVSGGDGVGVT